MPLLTSATGKTLLDLPLSLSLFLPDKLNTAAPASPCFPACSPFIYACTFKLRLCSSCSSSMCQVASLAQLGRAYFVSEFSTVWNSISFVRAMGQGERPGHCLCISRIRTGCSLKCAALSRKMGQRATTVHTFLCLFFKCKPYPALCATVWLIGNILFMRIASISKAYYAYAPCAAWREQQQDMLDSRWYRKLFIKLFIYRD